MELYQDKKNGIFHIIDVSARSHLNPGHRVSYCGMPCGPIKKRRSKKPRKGTPNSVCGHCSYVMSDRLKNRQVDWTRYDAQSEWIRNLINGVRSHDGTMHNGSYPFIPSETESVFKFFIKLEDILRMEGRWSGHERSRRTRKFLDCGCGMGNIMMTAKVTLKSCDVYHGIELFDDTFALGQQFLGLEDRKTGRLYRLIQRNIAQFGQYDRYDIIYYYCPFSDEVKQRFFEEKVENDMRVGAVLIPRLKKSRRIQTDARFEPIDDSNERAYIKVRK